ncbi:unnamed protein product [Orchesella dallaii]
MAIDGTYQTPPNVHYSTSERVLSGAYPLNSTTSYIIASNISVSTYYWEFLGYPDCYPTISCPVFLLKETTSCIYDFLTLSDGSSDVGLKFCGSNGPKNVVSQTTILIIEIRTKQTYSGYSNVVHPSFGCSVSCASPHSTFGAHDYGNTHSAYLPTPNYQSPVTWIPNTPPLVTNCDCGLRGPLINNTRSNTNKAQVKGGATTLIVGGELANVGEYRMQVAFVRRKDNDLRCGGTLLNNKYVLTAAHCCVDRNGLVIAPEEFAILLGAFDITDLELTGIKEDIRRITVHPLYDPESMANDVCVIELMNVVEIVSQKEPILRTTCLPPRRHNDPFVGSNLTVVGWGVTAERGDISNELLKVQVTALSNEQCNEQYDGAITYEMICAASPGKDSCQGDSGGPAFKEVYGRYMQVGVVSFGHGCARPDFPGVYARVTVLNDWIRMIARDGVWCRGLESYQQQQQQHYGSMQPVADNYLLTNQYMISSAQKPVYHV